MRGSFAGWSRHPAPAIVTAAIQPAVFVGSCGKGAQISSAGIIAGGYQAATAPGGSVTAAFESSAMALISGERHRSAVVSIQQA